MDKICIKDLEVYGFHGVNQEEKNLGQRFLISVELGLSLREAGISDDLNKTVNYAELCNSIEREFIREKYDLIEKAAEELANYILTNYQSVETVKILLKKPWAPIGKPVDYAAVEIERYWHKVYIGLGSNLGDKEKNLDEALAKLNNRSCKVEKVSPKYCTKPVGYTDQDDFLNCAAELKTLYTPEELIKFMLDIEKELKRERIIRWGPRTIDLDVLLYDDIVSHKQEIIIPHPRMQERLFVLKPLNDIAAEAFHPVLRKSINEMYNELSESEQ